MIVRNLTIRRNFPVLARIDAGFQLGYSGVGSGPRQGGGLTCGGTFRGSRCLHATDLRRTPLSPGSRCASTPPRTSCLPVSRSAERRAPSCRESPESPQDASGRFPAPGAVRAAVAARIPQKGFRAASCAPPPENGPSGRCQQFRFAGFSTRSRLRWPVQVTGNRDIGTSRDIFPTPLYREIKSPDFDFFFFEFIFSYACVGKKSLEVPKSLVESGIGGNLGNRAWFCAGGQGMRAGYCRPSPDFNENAPAVHSVVFHDLRGWRRSPWAAARRYPVLPVAGYRDAGAVRRQCAPGVLECRFPAMPSIISRGAPIRTDSVAPGNHASGPSRHPWGGRLRVHATPVRADHRPRGHGDIWGDFAYTSIETI
jgi:hypothetical protein